MSTVSLTGASAYAGNDRLLAGIVMSVLTFWLFASRLSTWFRPCRIASILPSKPLRWPSA